MKKIPVNEQQREWFLKLIDTHPEIEPKGKTMPYTSHNGHMFTAFSNIAEFGMRMSKEDREAFLEKYNTEILKSYGAVMKEYVIT